MLSLRVLVSRAALAACAIGGTAPMLRGGQCELVQLPSYSPAGTAAWVRAVGTWDPDAGGPQPENLIACGSFQQAGSVLCQSIAMFDGTEWRRVGTVAQIGGNVQLYAVTDFDHELVIGGYFANFDGVPAQNVARWNGVSWRPMGSELSFARSFAQRNGQLFASVSLAGPSATSTVVQWDGTRWSPISPPIVTTGILAADDAGNLIVAGPLSLDGTASQRRVARWDGSSWTLLGGVFDADLSCVVARGDEIFVGGSFHNIDGLPARHLVRWDDTSWQPAADPIDGLVFALQKHGNDVVLGGSFRNVGGVPANRIARWDGTTFHPLGSGLDFGTHKYCYALTEFRGSVVAGGSFGQAGDEAVAHIASWNGADWSRLGGEFGLAGTPTQTEETSVDAIGKYQGDVVIGGALHIVAGSRNIARRTANGWAGFGTGVGFEVFALAETSQGLLAAGSNYSNFSGPIAHPVALWNGESWEQIGLGAFPNLVVVYDVAEFQGEFIIAGDLRSGTGIGEGNLRHWNGTEWLALGPPTASIVREVIVHEGELIAAGTFIAANGEEVRGIARWNGSDWRPVGNSNELGMNVTCLTIYNGELHAGGAFNFGDGGAYRVARFDGQTWHPIPSGLNLNASIETMTEFSGNLFVGGRFGRANGEWSPGIARWSAAHQEWRSVRVSANESERFQMWDLCAIDGELLAASTIEDQSFDTYGPIVARWTCAPARPCPGDLDGNNDVDMTDLAMLLTHFGEQSATGEQIADIDGDDAVTLTDLATLLRDFGAACEP